MPQVRPQLVRGFVVLLLFIALIIPSSLFQPYQISTSEYTHVDLRRVRQDPPLVSELNISSSATVKSLLVMNGESLVFTVENVTLLISTDDLISEPLSSGDFIYFRGTLHTEPSLSVDVNEFYVFDRSSSIIRSIPGIILFIVMFFSIFTIDLKHIAFVPRRRDDA
jgi:hypothetical protein